MAKSILQNQHDQLVSELQYVSQEVSNNLNSNYFTLNEKEDNFADSVLSKDPALAYNLFSSLLQLDAKVMGTLYSTDEKNARYKLENDEIGKPLTIETKPYQRFRLDYIQDTINTMSESISYIIKKVSQYDKQIAIFMEAFWKFIVVIYDIISKWSYDRYSNLLKEQEDKFRVEINELKAHNQNLQEQILAKNQGNQMRLVMEQKKYQKIKQQYQELQVELNNLKWQYEEYSSLENAKGTMYQIDNKLKDSENTIRMIDRLSNDRKVEISKSIQNIGQYFLSQHNQAKAHYKYVQERLGFQTTKKLTMVHPFTTFIINYEKQGKEREKKKNQQELLPKFLIYLQNNISQFSNNYKSPCLLFLDWCDRDSAYDLVSSIVESQEDIYVLFKNIFGTNGKVGIGSKYFKEFILLTGAMRKNQKDVSIQYDPIRINDQFTDGKDLEMIQYDSMLSESQKQYLQNEILQLNNFTYCQLLILVLKILSDFEREEWDQKVNSYKEKIMDHGVNSEWIDIKCGEDQLIWEYVSLGLDSKKQISMGTTLEAVFDDLWKFKILKPHLFLQPQEKKQVIVVHEPQEQPTLQRKTSIFSSDITRRLKMKKSQH